ncbi:MAG: class I tRNA ligase family protein [Pseudonocardia sp.]
MEAFDPRAIERRWQQVWNDEQTWHVANDTSSAPLAYVLEMLPYTSGEPHVGHLKNYAVGDAVAHFIRRRGHTVLHPMGYDAFGLPAEGHAIRTGKNPRVSTDESIASFRRQFSEWGISIDWSRSWRPIGPSTIAGHSGSSCGCSGRDSRTGDAVITAKGRTEMALSVTGAIPVPVRANVSPVFRPRPAMQRTMKNGNQVDESRQE